MDEKSQPSEEDLGLSLIETLGSSSLINITQDLTEVAIDSVLQDGILRDIPIVGTIVGLSKTVISVRDKLLVRKLLDFLQEVNITTEERIKFLSDIEGDKHFQRRIGENLIMLLDHLDDLNKPKMIAKLFKSYLRDEITYKEFLRFASIVERAFIEDLAGLLASFSDRHNRGESLYTRRFYHLGLSELVFDDSAYVKSGEEKRQSGYNYNPFHTPLEFRFTTEAYAFGQILLGKKVQGTDFLKVYQKERDYREISE